MHLPLSGAGARCRTLFTRLFARLGLREDSFLLILAVLIGIVTAGAAVGFHELIDIIRTALYASPGSRLLYGKAIALLIVIPAAGGLAVGVVSRFVFRQREGHGIIDVMEAVARSSGRVRPISALEKIITSAMTIGTGGSAGAEGPIVQIGAGIASGIGHIFAITRQHLPVLIGCGCAAGISAIFNSPIGGVFFALEIILLDFSLRTFTPVVLASVVANVTTKGIFELRHETYAAIFAMPAWEVSSQAELSWSHMGFFALLGLICGIVGVTTTRLMNWSEHAFSRMPVPRWLRPALGGALVGILGVLYVIIFGWILLGRAKPIAFEHYPLPAFYSDGYGVVRQLLRSGPGEDTRPSEPAAATSPAGWHGRVLSPAPPGPRPTPAASASPPAGLRGFYAQHSVRMLLALLGSLCVLKLIATCLTLSSGGAGGIIAPSLFMGSTAGGCLGVVLFATGYHVAPNVYALVGMGAVLSAVVHAPIASILILLELTQDYKIILPAMLATVIAAGVARLIFRDSVYTIALRGRGVRVGTAGELVLLRRLCVEQVPLEPAACIRTDEPLAAALKMIQETGAGSLVVLDERQQYCGMLAGDDLRPVLFDREAVPLLLVRDLLRPEIPLVTVATDLARVLDLFSLHDVDRLPVAITKDSARGIGLLSRSALIRRYQRAMSESE